MSINGFYQAYIGENTEYQSNAILIDNSSDELRSICQVDGTQLRAIDNEVGLKAERSPMCEALSIRPRIE